MSCNYQNGKIYCIRNNVSNDVYVGSSCEPYLSKRMVKHRSSAKNERDRNMLLHQKMNEIGIEHFHIELIENYPCESKDQLRAREGHYIREMATLNKRIETRTDKEWREDNKEYIQEWKKQHYENNKESIREKTKQYQEDKIDMIKQRKKHYYEQNKEDIKEKSKQYREDNIDMRKQHKKDYYEENKEYIKQKNQED